MYDKNYELLADAIIVQAAKDYTEALCKLRDARRTIKECEEFFKGADFKIYTKIKGDDLIDMLREEAILHRYDLEAIKKSRIKKEP